jgi:hypothetical protein
MGEVIKIERIDFYVSFEELCDKESSLDILTKLAPF